MLQPTRKTRILFALAGVAVIAAVTVMAQLPSSGSATQIPLASAAAKARSVAADHTVLFQQVEQLRARAATASSPIEGVTILAQAVEKLDTGSLTQTDVTEHPLVAALLKDYITALLACESSVTAESGKKSAFLTTARYMAERHPDLLVRTNHLLAIAQRQAGLNLADSTKLTLAAAFRSAVLLDQPHADESLRQLVLLAANGFSETRRLAYFWAEYIKDPLRRSQALSHLARAQLAVGEWEDQERLQPFAGLPTYQTFDALGETLLGTAESLRIEGRLAPAAIAALAVPTAQPGRDNVLIAIVEQTATLDERDALRAAATAVQTAQLRDRALAHLARADLKDSRVSMARRLIEMVTGAQARALLWCDAAAVLADRKLHQQAADAAARALQIMQNVRLDPAALDRAYSQLATVNALASQWQAALSFMQKIAGRDTRVRSAVLIGEEALAANAASALSAAADSLRRDRSDVAWRLLSALALRSADHDAALQTAHEITDAVERGRALAQAARSLAHAGEKARARQIAAEIYAAYQKASLLQQRIELASQAIVALAASDQPELAATLLDDALQDEAGPYDLALQEFARALVRGGPIDRAKRSMEWALVERRYASSMRHIAVALAELNLFEQGAEYAREIPNVPQRVQTFRKLAEMSAAKLDQYRILDHRASDAESFLQQDAAKPAEARLPVVSERGFDFYAIDNDTLGQVIPRPNAFRIQTEAVSRLIPSPAAGRAFVIPMSYNAYNTKVIFNVISVFKNLDTQLFPVSAQGTRYPRYIQVDTGIFDLPTLARELELSGYPDLLIKTERTYTLRLPLLISPKATLILDGANAQALRLDQERGVFIVNAGRLWIHDIEISGWDSTAAAPAALDFETRIKFRPFILSWGGSEMSVASSYIHHLGFSGPKAYGFSYSQGPIAVQRDHPGGLKRPTGVVVNSSFEQMYFGFFTYQADDVALVGNEFRNNVIYGIDPHDFSERLLIAYNTAYGSQKKHGLIASREVNRSWLIGNLSFANHGTGIMLDRFSSENVVYANRAWGNDQDGMAVFESPCVIVAANTFAGNKQDGIKVRNSWDVGLFRNRIAGNAAVAINAYVGDPREVAGFAKRDLVKDPYVKFTSLAVVENQLEHDKGAVITSSGIGAIALKGNSFTGASRKLYEGDLQSIASRLLREQGAGIVARSSCPGSRTTEVCSFQHSYLHGTIAGVAPAKGSGPQCVGTVVPDQETLDASEEDDLMHAAAIEDEPS